MQSMQQPYAVRFRIEPYILALMYFCYHNKIPLDLLITLYERFGKHSLFFIKALACKKYVRVSDTQFYKVIDDCIVLTSQIKSGKVHRDRFDAKMNNFLDYLESHSENLYSYEVRFFFDLEEFYES